MRNAYRNEAMDKRRAPRIATANFLGYVCLDELGLEISEGYGWATNLSRTGIQMETIDPVESPVILLLLIDLDDGILEVRGEVIYCYEAGKRRYVHGIQLLEASRSRYDVVCRCVKACHGRDKDMLNQRDDDLLRSS